MFGFFKSRQAPPALRLFMVNIKVARGSNTTLSKALAGAYVSAYVTAPDDATATRLAVHKLSSKGFVFLDTQGPVCTIDPRQWSRHVAQSWPEFMEELPTQAALQQELQAQKVYFGPFVGYE